MGTTFSANHLRPSAAKSAGNGQLAHSVTFEPPKEIPVPVKYALHTTSSPWHTRFTIDWHVTHGSSFRDCPVNTYLYSQSIELDGFKGTWNLGLNVNERPSNTPADQNANIKYLGVYVHCVGHGPSDKPVHVTCTLTLSASGNNPARPLTMTKNYQTTPSWSWGFRKFLSQDQLFDTKNGYLLHDTLTIHTDVTISMGPHATVANMSWTRKPDSIGSDGKRRLPVESGHFSTELVTLFKTKKHCDFVLVSSDGQIFQGHRLILSISSAVFEAMLKPHTHEAQTGRCVIGDVDGETQQALLEFVYTGSSEFTPNLAEMLLIAADKYALLTLVDACVDYLASIITANNAVKLLVLASNYRIHKLTNEVCRFLGLPVDNGNT